MIGEKERVFHNNYAIAYEAIHSANAHMPPQRVDQLENDIENSFDSLLFVKNHSRGKRTLPLINRLRSLALARKQGRVGRKDFFAQIQNICQKGSLPPDFFENIKHRIRSNENAAKGVQVAQKDFFSMFDNGARNAVPFSPPGKGRVDHLRKKMRPMLNGVTRPLEKNKMGSFVGGLAGMRMPFDGRRR